jgi:predicted acylesterase/phospholipase RssA
MSLLDRLSSPGPKRILALDGGGIRGAATLGFLERIEELLRERHGRPDLRLCDYFDLIGGTSTGSIIASALAIGMSASEIKTKYLQLGGRVFGSKKIKLWQARFKRAPLEAELKVLFDGITLGDPSISTGLCIVTKRADTGSTWPLINHPGGKFYSENRDILLCRAILASAAAPVFFEPITIDLGGGQFGTFIDGGVSMANNPALRLFLVATLSGFPFRWQTGEDRLMVVSVGTGRWDQREDPIRMAASKVWDWARHVPAMLMSDALWQNQLLLQYLSRSPTPWHIDSEVGDLSDDLLVHEPALWYVRYDAPLDADGLADIGLDRLAPTAAALRNMSDARNRFDLAEIGERAAERQVQEDHFPAIFDIGAGEGG